MPWLLKRYIYRMSRWRLNAECEQCGENFTRMKLPNGWEQLVSVAKRLIIPTKNFLSGYPDVVWH